MKFDLTLVYYLIHPAELTVFRSVVGQDGQREVHHMASDSDRRHHRCAAPSKPLPHTMTRKCYEYNDAHTKKNNPDVHDKDEEHDHEDDRREKDGMPIEMLATVTKIVNMLMTKVERGRKIKVFTVSGSGTKDAN